jgi:hypothetical protein
VVGEDNIQPHVNDALARARRIHAGAQPAVAV